MESVADGSEEIPPCLQSVPDVLQLWFIVSYGNATHLMLLEFPVPGYLKF